MKYFLTKEAFQFLKTNCFPLLLIFDRDFQFVDENSDLPIVQKYKNISLMPFGTFEIIKDTRAPFTLEDAKLLLNAFDIWKMKKEFDK